MVGTGALAYTLGLRHAVDADHISAIDNVTRKLLNDNQYPVSVGLFFSLGHSTIVFIVSVIVAATANAVANGIDDFSNIGGIIGTSVSIAFLVLIATLNIIVLVGVLRTLRRVKKEGVYTELDIEDYLNKSGIMGRFFRPVFRFVNASWKMYPLGLLFGLGFDTSTEIILLGITAVQGARGMNMWLIILLPLLFASGMSLIDSLDGMLMLFTYTWAYINPVRKLYYNLTITSISVVVACLVALIEFFSLIGEQLNLENGWWSFWYTLSDSFEWIGIVIVGAFIVTWVVSAIVYRWLGYKALEKEFDLKKPNTVKDGKNESKVLDAMEEGNYDDTTMTAKDTEIINEQVTHDITDTTLNEKYQQQ
ncbi:high-affinity nickel-transport protein-domain-containing protein [Halteromyces radiatus]|uniref:high-affinity nickel-transport protein-domain-containing protein n=1 Tax=Halteromyces radiatus TaxID=101107 RepID=UPI00222019DA|nr:high-affinity nickel-transport protein-domain-containing protein [Halteromyces radiatus]KAI8098868.1 high-affinity nickel-transport protein-domain-containing protein [Halteromyces radiatus]